MPQIDPTIVTFLAGLAAAVTQLLKGLFLSEGSKRWLPLVVVALCLLAGGGWAYAYGRDILAGIFEGIIAGLTSLGFYSVGKAVAPAAVNSDGWLKRKKDRDG